MNQVKHQGLAALLMLAPVFSVHADCPETPSGEHTFLGVDTSVPANFSNRPEIRELDLLRVQLAWVPWGEESYRDQHLIDIDWVRQTSSNVDVWDGELQAITERDLHPVALLWSNPESGQVHLETCAGVFNSAGPVLMFAFYGQDGAIFHEATRVSPLVERTAVTNATVSSFIAESFNNGLDQQIITDVTKATGVVPGHYLAQSLLFQTLGPSVDFLHMNPAFFFDAKNAVVKQNRVYVTGNDSSARVPLLVDGVFRGGDNILDYPRVVHNLEDYPGAVHFQSRWGMLSGYNVVIDARPDLQIETTPCADGRSRITADFAYPSELPGEITLYLEDSPAPMTAGSSLDESVSCDHDYRIEGVREFEDESAGSGEVWVPVATEGTLVRIQYEANYQDDPPAMTAPSIETVLKLWNATDIESLYGRHEFFCDKPGDAKVDSIDEIAHRRATLLTAEEQASLDPFADAALNDRAWGDGDGDGSICDGDELSGDGDWGIITRITLSVYPPDG